jgi:hypothetical protein
MSRRLQRRDLKTTALCLGNILIHIILLISVLDPFVGTGSLLLAAAHFGGFVVGGDIDYLMLHGKTRFADNGSYAQSRHIPR